MPAPRRRNRLTQADLHRLFAYDPATGVITWRQGTGGRVRAGDEAGSVRTDGFVTITIKGKSWMAHRLIWLYMTGEHSKHRLFFRDGNPQNFVFSNIAEESEKHADTPTAIYQRQRRAKLAADA